MLEALRKDKAMWKVIRLFSNPSCYDHLNNKNHRNLSDSCESAVEVMRDLCFTYFNEENNRPVALGLRPIG